jgi:hypothetical protein
MSGIPKNRSPHKNRVEFDGMEHNLFMFENKLSRMKIAKTIFDYKEAIRHLKNFKSKLSKYSKHEFHDYIDNILDRLESNEINITTFERKFTNTKKLYQDKITPEFKKFTNSNPTRISTPRASPPRASPPKTPPRASPPRASPPRASPGSNKKTQKRCPKGYRRNKKTGNCDPV